MPDGAAPAGRWRRTNWRAPTDFLGCSRLRRESISGGEGFRGSDEAVVSDDPSGQHNPMASQGPLDGRVGVAGSRATLNRKALERVIPSGITYSWELQLRWRIRRSHLDVWPSMKVFDLTVDFCMLFNSRMALRSALLSVVALDPGLVITLPVIVRPLVTASR